MRSCRSQRRRKRCVLLLAFAAVSCHSTEGWSVKLLPRHRPEALRATQRTRIQCSIDSDQESKRSKDDPARKDSVSDRFQVQNPDYQNSQSPPMSPEIICNADSRPKTSEGRKRPKSFNGKIKTRFKAKRLAKPSASAPTASPASATAPSSSSTSSYSSLLPPIRPSDLYSSDRHKRADSDSLISGLSSWDDFLGVPPTDRSSPPPKDVALPNDSPKSIPDRLHSIQDLFPATPSVAGTSNTPKTRPRQQSQRQPKQFSMDGVLPVSDLFYRTSAASPRIQNQGQPERQSTDGVLPVSDLFYQARNDTDRSTSPNDSTARDGSSKAQGPRAKTRGTSSKQQSSSTLNADALSTAKKQRDRKMVRRGMEMLVGGVSINADPPQRSLELSYRPELDDWASVITLSTKDFGPLLHADSIKRLSMMERAIFCEYWVHFALKWKVCPKDLQEIVESHTHNLLKAEAEATNNIIAVDSSDSEAILAAGAQWASDELKQSVRDSHEVKIGTWFPDEMDLDSFFENVEKHFLEDTSRRRAAMDTGRDAPRGFGKPSIHTRPSPKKTHKKELIEARFGLTQKLPVAREDLESGVRQDGKSPIQNVFLNAFLMMIGEVDGFDAAISKFELVDQEDDATSIVAEFSVSNHRPMTSADIQRRLKRMGAAFEAATDSGYFQILIARAAKRETGWSDQVRNQVVNECLLADDDLNDSDSDFEKEEESNSISSVARVDSVSATRISSDVSSVDSKSNIPQCSLNNAANAPYKGELGLALYAAISEHAKERKPRVIAIGDVHGCVDELQDLLRECDYRPGDLVVMLGDLVCKGPGSLAVVEMSREIGAVSICGNHDYEVRRWQKAIESGVERPSVGTEHFHIATRLSKADMDWINILPWYIASKELGALFVHAGFVSGIRLAKQNPRLMTNMRSILPDGTVTSKFFNNWPWARLWDGPQTVLFGHDADRGLQQYEHAIGLDTGCVYGGRLTACILPEKRLVSVSARREYFKYRRKHYD